MALNNNLLVSWNFDTVTGSNGGGTFEVLDISSDYYGKGNGFSASDNSFVLKEDILTGKKQHFETLEGIDTIQIVDGDDERVSAIKKPSSIKLAIENSMYQIVSDEMMNLFASVNAYAFKFTVPAYKYKPEYEQLILLRKGFFESVQEKPNLERYIEFYKWIDSSLGALIDQLKPENSSDTKGLKVTVESHILERNKFQHKLPLTIQPSRVFDSGIDVIKSNSLDRSQKQPNFNGNIEDIVDTKNTLNKNFSANHQVIQTAGKDINNRGNKTNKTVLQTRFSSGDGLSETNRHTREEYSVYNDLNQRAIIQRREFNISESLKRPTSQGSNTSTDFADNNFIQRNVPYTGSNYTQENVSTFSPIPNAEMEFRQRSNLLIDDETKQNAVVEPPIQFSPPSKHIIRMNGGFEDMEIESPYYTKFATFSPRALQLTGNTLYFDKDINTFSDRDTFHRRIETIPSDQIIIKRSEIVNNIYPRKDMMGMAETRTKPNYEEGQGFFFTGSGVWSTGSYNNNTVNIRSFWRDNYENRKRTRGSDAPPFYTGSINCLNTYNVFQSNETLLNNISLWTFAFDGTYYYRIPLKTTVYNNYNDLLWSMEAKSSASYTGGMRDNKYFSYGYGDISAISHGEMTKFILDSYESPRLKPSFVFNNFPGLGIYSLKEIGTQRGFFDANLSYQTGQDARIRPFYDSYESFFENIKSKTQNYSIIPEYANSNFNNVISQNFNNPYNNENYLKILGKENGSDEIQNISEKLICDISKFIDKKSNKVKFIFNGVKKLLPYNGFYAQQASLQLINLFSSSYFENSNLNVREMQTTLQPLFAPGILFNTIKSGLAADYPVNFDTNPSTAPIYDTPTVIYDGTYYIIASGALTDRIKFEALLDPTTELFKKKTTNNYLMYLDPTHHSNIFCYSSTPIRPSVKLEKFNNPLTINSDKKYKYFINNFLSEIPNFFLKNNSLTYFSSKPENEFSVLQSGVEYKFNIFIKKNEKFSMFKTIQTGSNVWYLPEESLFGPPVEGVSNVLATADNELIVDSGTMPFEPVNYYPFCPPYLSSYYGGLSIGQAGIKPVPLEISFTPYDGTRKYTLDEILNNLTALTNPYYGLTSPYERIYSYENKMKLENCINYAKKINDNTITFDTITGLPTDTVQKDNYKWIIQTKFETPLINFYDQTVQYTDEQTVTTCRRVNSPSGLIGPTIDFYLTTKNNNIDGIWNAYGEAAEDGKSVEIYLDDNDIQNSLLKAVGFKQETKSIGQIAETKDIYEAVVILPYLKSLPLNQQSNDKFIKNITEDKYLIAITRQKINELLKVPNYINIDSNRDRRIDKIKTILNTNLSLDRQNSIIDLMVKMVNYNIPPHLNWLYDETIEPFVMYIAEFHHTLDKQDLADIWQGTMPKIAKTPEQGSVTIEHELNENELLGNIDLTKYDISGKVFKVKYRANGSYNDMLDDIEDNRSYKYAKKDESIPWYTYNWPYDNFSLVELVNIQQAEVFDVTVNSGSV
jgi:hypothetical protein